LPVLQFKASDYPFGIFKLFFNLNRGGHREPLNSNSLNMLYIGSKKLKVTITRIFLLKKMFVIKKCKYNKQYEKHI